MELATDSGLSQYSLCARTGVNVEVDDTIGVGKNSLCLICKNDLDLSAAFANQVAIVFNVINAGELVLFVAEELAVFFERENVGVGVNARLVYLIKAYKMVTDLVGGVAEHKNYLFASLGDTAQADGKTVS